MEIWKNSYNDLFKNQEILLDGLWCCNRDNPVDGCISSELSQLLGYTTKSTDPIQVDFLSLVYREDLKLIQDVLQSHIGTSGKLPFNIDIRLNHLEEYFIWFNLRGNMVSKGSGDFHGLLGAAICIDKYKETEHQLRLQKEHYKNVVKGANVGIWVADLITGNAVCNEKWAELMGYSLAELEPVTYDTFLSMVHPDDIKTIELTLENHIKKEGVYEVEFKIKHKKGHWVWVLSRGEVTQFNSEGQAEIVSGINYDITLRKSNELLLEKYKDLFERSSEAAKIGYWEVDQQDRSIFWSKVTKQLHEVSEDYRPTLEGGLGFYMEGENRDRIKSMVAKAIQEPFEFDEELQLITQGGALKWVRVIGISELKTDVGTRVYGLIQDIDQIKKGQLELKLKEEQFRQTFKHSGIGMALINVENKLLRANQNFCNIFGYSELEMQQLDLEKIAHQDDLRTNRKLIEELFAGKQKNLRLDQRFIHKNTSVIWANITLSAIQNDQGDIIHFVAQVQDITKRKQNELILAHNADIIERINDAAKIGIWELDLVTNTVYWSPTIKKMVDVPDDFVPTLEEAFLVFLEGEDRETIIEALSLAIKEGKGFDYELQVISTTNKVFWSRTIGIPDMVNGKCIRLYGFFQDITDRKQNELSLLNYKNILEQSHVIGKIGSWEINPEDKTVVWSDNLIRLVEDEEYRPHSLEFSLDSYVQKKDRKMMSDAIDSAIGIGTKFDLEIEILTHKKNLKWMRMIGVPEFENGKCKRLSGLIQDIAESKRMRLELGFSEEIFRTTFQHAAIGMLVIDLKGRLRKVNPRICEILGYRESEILEKTIYDLAHPADMNRLKAMMLEIKSGGQAVFKMEKRCVHKNKQYVWVNAAISAVKNDAGKFTHLVAQIQDISDKKQLTENLTEHNNRLINFAHIVSHNLRSHTSNISMLLDLVVQENPTVLKNEYFQNIKIVSDSMNETIYHLNEIIEINSKVSSTLTMQNLLENVQKAISTVRSLIDNTGTRIDVDIDKEVNVLAVHAYLESIILNLITNAIKYKSPDRHANIKITSGTEGDYAYLSIADNGLGIDLDKFGTKLFGMYKTFHSHPEARGIGLFISKNQIESMGGRIKVESEINKGTKFIVYFRII